MEKRRNNKGFSLVELIVVVAIMAVLMTVLAPQLLRYVERTRLQKDNSAIAEMANAIELSMADEFVREATPDGTTVTITANAAGTDASITLVDASGNLDASAVTVPAGTAGANASVLASEIRGIFGDEFATESQAYNASTANIVLTIDVAANGSVTVSAVGFIEAVDQAPRAAADPWTF